MLTADYRTLINRDLPLVERGCTSKAAYLSQAEARFVSRHGHGSNGQLRPYHCWNCSHWHLGHRRRTH